MSEFHQRLEIGIVVERRRLASAWASETWLPVAVLPHGGDGEARRLRADEEGEQYLLAPAELVLHRSDAASYRYNLAGERPTLFIALRRADELRPVPWRVLLVTAAPDEAQKLMECGEDVVEAVAMPEMVRAWIADFTDRCPADQPFEKRKRKDWRSETERP